MTVMPMARRTDPDLTEARADLAAAFRWTARLDMHEGVANHFSLAVSDDGQQFLINPRGRHFSRIRARDLVLVDAGDPTTTDRPDAPERTAWALHGAVHRNVPAMRCVMHVHSHYATALACLADPSIPPVEQTCMRFYRRTAIDRGYGGLGLDEEAERVSRLFAQAPVLIMGNHGVMIGGPSVAWVFDELFYFERACRTLLTAYATGRPLSIVSDAVAAKTRDQWLAHPDGAEDHFRELRAILDDEGSDYAA